MPVTIDGTNGVTAPNLTSTTSSTLASMTQALNLGSTGQIVFPATDNPSSNANTLDDYEEGTWTPTLVGGTVAGTTTYGTQNGWYIKIGKQVTVWYYLYLTAATGTGELRISNLPFTSASNIQGTGSIMTDSLNWTANGSIVTYISANSAFLLIYTSGDDVVWTKQLVVNEEQSLIGTHTYFT